MITCKSAPFCSGMCEARITNRLGHAVPVLPSDCKMLAAQMRGGGMLALLHKWKGGGG